MFRPLLFLILSTLCLQAQTPAAKPAPDVIVNQPFGLNLPRDLLGPTDPRGPDGTCKVGPCIWGNADSDTAPVQFFPPAGYRTVITGVHGNFVSFIKQLPGDAAPPPGSKAETLMGLQSSSGLIGAMPNPATPKPCDYCGTGTPVFVMGIVSAEVNINVVRYDFDGRFLLDADNVLVQKVAEFLNTTSMPIHLEFAGVVSFNWEKIPALK